MSLKAQYEALQVALAAEVQTWQMALDNLPRDCNPRSRFVIQRQLRHYRNALAKANKKHEQYSIQSS